MSQLCLIFLMRKVKYPRYIISWSLKLQLHPTVILMELVYDSDMNEILKGKQCNIDEVNFLFKRMDSFDTKERKVFSASAFAENPETIVELINLSFNTHC